MQIGRAGVSTSVSFGGPEGECVVKGDGKDRPFVGLLAGFNTDYAVDFQGDTPGVSTLHGVPVTQTRGLGKDCVILDLETQSEWSVFPHAGREIAGTYRPGSASFTTTRHKIECELTFTTMHNAQAEVWMVKFTNLSARGRSLRFSVAVEPYLGTPLEMAYSRGDQTILMRQPLLGSPKHLAVRQTQNLVMFMSSTLPVSAIALSKADETDSGPDNRLELDAAEQTICTVTDEPIGRLSVDIDLPIEGEAEFAFCMGTTESPEAAVSIVSSLSGIGAAADNTQKVSEQWQAISKGFTVETPDSVLDALVNTWLPYQLYTVSLHNSSHFSKLSPWSAADEIRRTFGIATAVPDSLKEALESFAPCVLPGSTYSSDGRSLIVSPPEELIWLVCGVLRYLMETGDTNILDLSVQSPSHTTSTIGELCNRATRLFTERLESSTSKYPGKIVDQWVRAWGECTSDKSLMKDYAKVAERLRNAAQKSCSEPVDCEQAAVLRTFCPSFWEPEIQAVVKEALGSQPQQLSRTSVYCLINSAIREGIFGIRPSAKGLLIEPRIPASWPECKARRVIRQDTYEFNIIRLPKVNGSVIASVDDAPWGLSDNFLPYFEDGLTHRVTVHVQ